MNQCDLNHNLTKRSRNTSKAVRTQYGFLSDFGDDERLRTLRQKSGGRRF